MSKKSGRKQEDETDRQEEERRPDRGADRGDFERFTERDIPEPGYRNKLNQFLTLAQHNSNRAVFYLYRITRGKRSLLSKYYSENDIPDEHDAGLRWGSGDYDLVMTAPPLRPGGKSIIMGYPFCLDAYYDELRLRANPQAMTAVQGQQQDNGKSLLDAMAIVQGLIGTLAPLIRPEAPPDIQKLYATNNDILGRVMRQNMDNSVALMNDYQRKVLALKQPKDDGDGDADEQGIVEKIIPYIKDWLPLLISGGAPAAQVAAVAKKTALFKEVARSRQITNTLIRYLDQDKGPEATNSVLRSLGLKRAGGGNRQAQGRAKRQQPGTGPVDTEAAVA